MRRRIADMLFLSLQTIYKQEPRQERNDGFPAAVLLISGMGVAILFINHAESKMG